MSASIQIRGIDQAVKKLGLVATTTMLEPPMQRAVLRLQRDMAEYPPQPPASTYRRTGTLGRKWTVKVARLPNGLRGTVGNNTWYAPLVQSRRFQTAVHRRHGWITDTQAVNQNERAIVADFEAALKRATA